MFVSTLISYLWFYYNESRLGRQPSKSANILLAVPIFIALCLCFSSPWTGLIYYIDALNIYHRGPMHFMLLAISYTYLVGSLVHVMIRMHSKVSRSNRQALSSLLLFIVLPTIGGIVSALIYGIPTIWPLSTISLMMIFTNFQAEQISTDGLTELHNRRQFNRDIQSAIADTHRTTHLFLILMDVNLFKYINDTFGHIEGDHALMITARILRESCTGFNATCARYGGDEFAIVCYLDGITDLTIIEERITAACLRFSNTPGSKYTLSLSIGHAEYSDMNETAEQFIGRADMELYTKKTAFRAKLEASQTISQNVD